MWKGWKIKWHVVFKQRGAERSAFVTTCTLVVTFQEWQNVIIRRHITHYFIFKCFMMNLPLKQIPTFTRGCFNLKTLKTIVEKNQLDIKWLFKFFLFFYFKMEKQSLTAFIAYNHTIVKILKVYVNLISPKFCMFSQKKPMKDHKGYPRPRKAMQGHIWSFKQGFTRPLKPMACNKHAFEWESIWMFMFT